MEVKKVNAGEKGLIREVVEIHIKAFQGFFLTFLGKGFLKTMYTCYTEYQDADLLIAVEEGKVLGFVAYSVDMSAFYKYMIKHKLFSFAWFSFLAFLRKPAVFLRLIRAFLRPSDSKREEKYVELASISVDPDAQGTGVGSKLINAVKKATDFQIYSYITLETDAVDNESANQFYQKNGFVLYQTFTRTDKRIMNEYRYYNENSCT